MVLVSIGGRHGLSRISQGEGAICQLEPHKRCVGVGEACPLTGDSSKASQKRCPASAGGM